MPVDAFFACALQWEPKEVSRARRSVSESHGGKKETPMALFTGVKQRSLPKPLQRLATLAVLCAAALFVPVAALAADPNEDGQWTMPGKNTQLTRYSRLDQITTENAKN